MISRFLIILLPPFFLRKLILNFILNTY